MISILVLFAAVVISTYVVMQPAGLFVQPVKTTTEPEQPLLSQTPKQTDKTAYFYANGQKIVSMDAGGILYYITDHLGGTNKVYDQDGNVVSENEYYAYGQDKLETGEEQDYKYTGKEEDDSTGLYYYGARYYEPLAGRFMAIDSVKGDIQDPQSLNRYAYTRNNPLKYVDPSGNDDLPYGVLEGDLAPNSPLRNEQLVSMDFVDATNEQKKQTASTLTSSAPFAGDCYDALCLAAGEDLLTGEEFDAIDYGLQGLATLLPVAGGSMVRKIGGKVLEDVTDGAKKLFHDNDIFVKSKQIAEEILDATGIRVKRNLDIPATERTATKYGKGEALDHTKMRATEAEDGGIDWVTEGHESVDDDMHRNLPHFNVKMPDGNKKTIYVVKTAE